MKIKSLDINNFRGIKSLTLEMPHIAAICGKNGIGKTSLLDALRFALTGEEPAGEIIRYGSNSTQVTIDLESETGEITSFTRLKERGKPSKFKIDGKATTQKALNDAIQSVTGLAIDNIKVLASSEIVRMMKPQEFASLILGYIPEKMTLEKVLSFIPATTPGMIDIIDANLPVEGIDLAILDEFDFVARSIRKDLKADLAAKKLIYDKHIKEKPEAVREEVEAKLKSLISLESEYTLYLEKQRAYESTMASREKSLEAIKEFQKEADAIKATRPDPEALRSLVAKETSEKERLMKQQSALCGIDTAINTLKTTLDALSTNVCPISPLITCKTDKSVAKSEIEETIAATEESKGIVMEEIASIEKALGEIAEQIKKENENASLYERRISIQKQIKSMEDSLPPEPIKPEPVEKKDVTAEKFQLEQMLDNLKDYEEGCKIASQINELEVEVSDYESIVKMLAEKGPVRTGVVQSYLGLFETLCNDRSASIRPEISFRFASEGGVVVYMKNSKTDTELTINELSGGEKAYMLYIIIDMLNELIGARVLMLDEMEVMDAETFNYLLDLVLKHSADYDHVLLSAVNHEELVSAFKAHEIRMMDLNGSSDPGSLPFV